MASDPLRARLEEALRACDAVLTADDSLADAWNDSAVILCGLGRPQDALARIDRALALRPRDPDALNNRATLMRELGRLDDALHCFGQALAIDPDHVDALSGRAATLRDLDRSAEAVGDVARALALRPDHARALNNQAMVFVDLGRYDEAAACLDRALALQPAPSPRLNKALLCLLKGDFRQGWALYESRPNPVLPGPRFTGAEDVRGKTVLVFSEQGLGDVLQFCRYLPLLRARGANVVAQVPAPLRAVVSTLGPGIRVLRGDDTSVSFDCSVPMMSLPLALGTTLETVPASVPYLFAAPDKVAAWSARLGPKRRPRIGLAWSGSPLHRRNRTRSIPLALLAPLIELDADVHSLQVDAPAADQDALGTLPLLQHREALTDFSETAGLVEAMDLVVSVDTSVAHLAGAMGKPVWILLPFAPDFRWMLGRADTPWYPSATLHRQVAAGDWASVVAAVCAALREYPGLSSA